MFFYLLDSAVGVNGDYSYPQVSKATAVMNELLERICVGRVGYCVTDIPQLEQHRVTSWTCQTVQQL